MRRLLRMSEDKSVVAARAESTPRPLSGALMRRLSRHVGINILVAIAMALLVLVGLDVIAAIIDEAGATRNNYHFSDALIYVGTKLPSTIYEYIPFASLIGCLFGLGILATNSEVIVMRASGVSLLRIVFFVIRPVLLFVLLALLWVL